MGTNVRPMREMKILRKTLLLKGACFPKSVIMNSYARYNPIGCQTTYPSVIRVSGTHYNIDIWRVPLRNIAGDNTE